jgi:hypothetical protein
MVLDSGVDIEGTALASRSTRLIATTPDGSRLDATFNLSKKFFGISIDMTLENRGITIFVQSRLHIVSSLIVPSYLQ